jgi:hypothetical protein
MKLLKLLAIISVIIFAIIGLVFSGVFVAMQFGWLNVRGSIEDRNNSILDPASNAANLIGRPVVISTTTRQSSEAGDDYSCNNQSQTCSWTQTREWAAVSGGLEKDSEIINRVSLETGVPARLIAAVVVPEQIRFFTSSREVFKRYFEPLKILGSLSQFSLGVSGIKQDTARLIEEYANDSSSIFYPGENIAPLLSYKEGVNQEAELYNRLTDEKDHYFSYLYTAVFIKQILSQWERSGYDISNQPAIIGTIFNLGFNKSKPKAEPQVGGATITVGGTNYTFGYLAGLFCNSTELPSLR